MASPEVDFPFPTTQFVHQYQPTLRRAINAVHTIIHRCPPQHWFKINVATSHADAYEDNAFGISDTLNPVAQAMDDMDECRGIFQILDDEHGQDILAHDFDTLTQDNPGFDTDEEWELVPGQDTYHWHAHSGFHILTPEIAKESGLAVIVMPGSVSNIPANVLQPFIDAMNDADSEQVPYPVGIAVFHHPDEEEDNDGEE